MKNIVVLSNMARKQWKAYNSMEKNSLLTRKYQKSFSLVVHFEENEVATRRDPCGGMQCLPRRQTNKWQQPLSNQQFCLCL